MACLLLVLVGLMSTRVRVQAKTAADNPISAQAFFVENGFPFFVSDTIWFLL